MVLIKILGKKYECPTSWEEVKDFAALCQATNPREEIQALTGCPDIMQVSDKFLFPLMTLISFLEEDMPIVQVDTVSVAEDTYEKMIMARQALTTPDKAYKKLFNLHKIYKNPKDSNIETIHILSSGMALLAKINVFLSVYEEMFAYQPKADEIQAGIEDLSVFSAISTAYHLANEDLMKIDQVLKQPAVTVYTILHYNFLKARYQERLNDIRFPAAK